MTYAFIRFGFELILAGMLMALTIVLFRQTKLRGFLMIAIGLGIEFLRIPYLLWYWNVPRTTAGEVAWLRYIDGSSSIAIALGAVMLLVSLRSRRLHWVAQEEGDDEGEMLRR